jgi:hypothetical protein
MNKHYNPTPTRLPGRRPADLSAFRTDISHAVNRSSQQLPTSASTPPSRARLVDRLEIAPLVDGAHRRVGGYIPMAGTSAAIGEDGSLAKTPVVVPSRLEETAAAESHGGIGRRLLAAVRAWHAAGQLGPDRDMIVGRHSGARC